jgi:hypothetical protein
MVADMLAEDTYSDELSDESAAAAKVVVRTLLQQS